MRAYLNLRHNVPVRIAAFRSGLRRLGYEVVADTPSDPGKGDIFVTWNRIGRADQYAAMMDARGLAVLVAENSAWGNDFCGQHWYTIARGWHNLNCCFDVADDARFDSLAAPLQPFRTAGEVVILPQRGIGPAVVAMPPRWPHKAFKRHGGRVRMHPGTQKCVPLEQDLANCGEAVTWGSGAAIKALMMGIPVTSYLPGWIGQQDNTEMGRLGMLRRLAWAQWRLEEIASGEAFKRLLV